MTTLAIVYAAAAIGFALGMVTCALLVMAGRSQQERRRGPVA